MIIKKALYQTIYDDIVNKIFSGQYKVNDKLPSEAELDKIYSASRTPVRHALNKLESDGYIYRLQGVGSFVADKEPVELWTKMTGFKHYYQNKWEKISSQTISIEQIKCIDYSQLLNIQPNIALTHIRRIRYLNNKKLIYLKHYLHPRIPIEIFNSDYNFTYLGRILKDYLQIELVKSDEEIEAVAADEDVASVLNIPTNTPVLKVTRVSYDQFENPTDVNVYFVNTKDWKYHVSFIQEESFNEKF